MAAREFMLPVVRDEALAQLADRGCKPIVCTDADPCISCWALVEYAVRKARAS